MQLTSCLAALLTNGPLEPVSVVAEQVLGHRVVARTALRWALAGRNGVRLPTVRGCRRIRCTTVAAFRSWLEASSAEQQLPASESRPLAGHVATDEVADAVLKSFGLGRDNGGA